MDEVATIRDEIVSSDKHLFVTGPGGTGKTRNTVYALVEMCKASPQLDVAFTAFTGVATVNLQRFLPIGTKTKTLHSWLCINTKGPPNIVDVEESRYKHLKTTKILFVDEVSMIPAGLFDQIDGYLRKIRGDATIPFGGLRLVLVGDMLQLAPIGDRDIRYSKIWESLELKRISLKIPHRFAGDLSWFNILNRIRRNNSTREDRLLINSRRKSENYIKKWERVNGQCVPRLYCHRKVVDEYNEKKLAEIDSPPYTFIAQDITRSNVTDYVRSNLEKIISIYLPKSITIKVGAFVMITTNVNTDLGIVNGTIGTITEIMDDAIHLINHKTKHSICLKRAAVDCEFAHHGLLRLQFPLQLAYAFTVHKAQGCEFDRVVLDVNPKKMFSSGHLYTMLSRAKSLKSIFIVGAGL